MTEPIQAMAPQEHPPKTGERVDAMLKRLETHLGMSRPDFPDELNVLKEYIDLLRRQAAHAREQRKALKMLNRAHRMLVLELRWVWGLLTSVGTKATNPDIESFPDLVENSKANLWGVFRAEMTKTGPGAQVDKLANFIMAEVPGEPSRDEGAVDTAIRVMKELRKTVDTIDKSHIDVGRLVVFLTKVEAVDMGHFVNEDPVKMAIRIITEQQDRIKHLTSSTCDCDGKDPQGPTWTCQVHGLRGNPGAN